jgi:prepilin-type N-terminal cleavage/methylation domain-containing protein
VNLKPSTEQGEESNKVCAHLQCQHPQYPCQSAVGEGESDGRHGGARMRLRRSVPRSGFTLLEMLAVMFIIAILSTMVTSVVSAGRRQARQTDCKSNLRQMGVAILVYRGEHNGANPPWLSNLYPDYLDDKRVFICRSDKGKGVGVIRPADLPDDAGPLRYPEVIDNNSRAIADGTRQSMGQNTNVFANSYFYEFCEAVCSWKPPRTWSEVKEEQLRFGDKANGGGIAPPPDPPKIPAPYSQSKLPIVRCYHHHKESRIPAYPNEATKIAKDPKTIRQEHIAINVAYAGNVYVGPLYWEGMLEPGE